jgi:hypothetical protein
MENSTEDFHEPNYERETDEDHSKNGCNDDCGFTIDVRKANKIIMENLHRPVQESLALVEKAYNNENEPTQQNEK